MTPIKQIWQSLVEVRNLSGNDKAQRLTELLECDDVREALILAYDPFKRYYVTPSWSQVYEKEGVTPTPEEFFMKIEDIYNGTIPRGSAAETEVDSLCKWWGGDVARLFIAILNKDLRCGIGASLINKCRPETVPTFEVMLSGKFKAGKNKYPLLAEPKLDGVRVTCLVDAFAGSVQFLSRTGKEFTSFDHLKPQMLDLTSAWRSELMSQACDAYDALGLPDGEDTDTDVMDSLYGDLGVDEAFTYMFDGEVISGDFNKTVSDVRKKDTDCLDAMFLMFDAMPMIEFTTVDSKKFCKTLPFNERRLRLRNIIKASDESTIPNLKLTEMKMMESDKDVADYYAECRAKGLEGVMVKEPKHLYRRKRDNAWMKIKAEESVDVPVVGIQEGTGKYENMMGALLIDFNGVIVNIGTGFSDAQRESFWLSYLDDIENETGSIVGRLVEVEYHEITPDGSLRHPRFVRFRDDKAE